MFNGLDQYKLRGRGVVAATRETASRQGAVAPGREVANSYKRAGTETAASTSTSSMGLGGVTDEDISLNYIGGSSNAKSGANTGSGAPPEVYKYYNALYREDSICGAAIELRANIPYGDFAIQGVAPARLQKYEEAVDNMRLRSMMPRVAIERDVQGAYLGLLDWNSAENTYDSMLSYSRQFISKIIYPLVHGMDPVIDVQASAFLTDIANSNDPRLADIKKCIPTYLLQGVSGSAGIPVPMDSVVWIDRPHVDPRYNSLLHRILPTFLIERALTRGTIEAAHRRQRGILHITAGSGDLWLATPEEMAGVAELFNNADADPLGAIVVTREGISPQEVRSPTDFWRSIDSYEQTVAFKLRAMGISESFLSGDATFNNAEVAISTFLQQVKTERAQVTDQMFRRKVFLQIARANDFRIGGKERGAVRDPRQGEMFDLVKLAEHVEMAANAANATNDISMFDLPKLEWKQSLMPEGDAAYIEMLTNLAAQGMPAPIRALFAAGGLDFDNIMDNQSGDIKDRKKLTAYIDKIKEASPQVEQEGGEGDEFAMFGATREVGLLNRGYEDAELYEPYTEVGTKRTRPMTSKGKRVLRDKQHKEMAHALARLADTNNRKIRAQGEFES